MAKETLTPATKAPKKDISSQSRTHSTISTPEINPDEGLFGPGKKTEKIMK